MAEASSTLPVEGRRVDPADVRLVILAAGSSTRMGWNKLAVPLAGIPLARRIAEALASLGPLMVAGAEVAVAVAGVPGVELLPTAPTASTGATLALADAAIDPHLAIAVVACDLPFLDAGRVRTFLERVPAEADFAYPIVGGVPGHPVVWSARARRRIAGLNGAPPWGVRKDPHLSVIALAESDDVYVLDVDTPDAWAAAEERLRPSLT